MFVFIKSSDKPWTSMDLLYFHRFHKKRTGAFSNPPLFVVWGFMPSAAKILYLEKCEGFKQKMGGVSFREK